MEWGPGPARANKKTLCLFPQETKRQIHSAVPLSLAAPSRETTPHSPPTRGNGVTSVTRPSLLASSFSRRLQGDFRLCLLSALHQNGGSLCSRREGTRPYPRRDIQLSKSIIPFFFSFVNGKMGKSRKKFRIFCKFRFTKGHTYDIFTKHARNVPNAPALSFAELHRPEAQSRGRF